MSFNDKLFEEVIASQEGSYAISILGNLLGELYSKYEVYTDTDELVSSAIEMYAETTFDELGGVDDEDEDEDEDEDDIPSSYAEYDYDYGEE